MLSVLERPTPESRQMRDKLKSRVNWAVVADCHPNWHLLLNTWGAQALKGQTRPYHANGLSKT